MYDNNLERRESMVKTHEGNYQKLPKVSILKNLLLV